MTNGHQELIIYKEFFVLVMQFFLYIYINSFYFLVLKICFDIELLNIEYSLIFHKSVCHVCV